MKKIIITMLLATASLASAQNYGYPQYGQRLPQYGQDNWYGYYRSQGDATYYNQLNGNMGSVGRGHWAYNPFTGRSEWVPNN